MAYWLTTQWPLRAGETEHSGIWVTDNGRPVIARVSAGDLVVIFESATGRTQVVTRADGTTVRRPCGRGRRGVVAIHRVVAPAVEAEDSEPEDYTDGSRLWWRWTAPTDPVISTGFVSWTELNTLLGFEPNYNYRGFGQRHSGLGEITQEQFEAIRTQYSASQNSAVESAGSRIAAAARRGGPGGEGPGHRMLKEWIAQNPEALGEDGMSLVQLEMPFPTGDRIDVVLRDRFGRLVAVEVEGICDETEIAGPLQCAKYRALLSYAFDRPHPEVRAILAAPAIDRAIVSRCEIHGIEARLVSIPQPSASRA